LRGACPAGVGSSRVQRHLEERIDAQINPFIVVALLFVADATVDSPTPVFTIRAWATFRLFVFAIIGAV
jgi:hypothetical protein